MIDPETARQALQAWDDAYGKGIGARVKAGDALAVLVPQLLDQLAAAGVQYDQLDDLAFDAITKRDALGERVRQLETALRTIVDEVHENEATGANAAGIARAALGDTPPTSRTNEQVKEALGGLVDAWKEYNGEPPQPETPKPFVPFSEVRLPADESFVWRPETEGT